MNNSFEQTLKQKLSFKCNALFIEYIRMGKIFLSKINNYFLTVFKGLYLAPKALLIELTNECNANCIMCGREKRSREKLFMDLELFKTIILDARDSQINVIQLSFYGEPLLYPSLVDAVWFVRKRIPNASIVISTNASLLGKNIAIELIEAGLNMFWISIDGNNKNEFEQIRPGLRWDTVRKNIKDLHKVICENKYNVKVFIRGLNTNGFVINEIKYKKEWESYSDLIYIRDDHEIAKKSYEKLLHKISPCGALFSQMVILANGDVTMCFYDWGGEMSYAKYSKGDIKKIWKDSRLIKRRILHIIGLKKTISFCKNCSYRAYNW